MRLNGGAHHGNRQPEKAPQTCCRLGISSLLVLGAAACDSTEDTEDPADQQE
jgi:hypothetical protein